MGKDEYDLNTHDNKIKTIKKYTTLQHGLPYQNAQPFQGNILPANLFFSETIKDTCRLFSGLILIETNVFVSHGRYLS